MSGQHPMNWGIDSDGEAQYPTTEPWPEYSGDPPYPQDIGTDEGYSIRDYPGGSQGPAYRYALPGTLTEADSVHSSAGSTLSPPPPPPLPPYGHNNLGWQATTYSPTTNSPFNTPQMVAQVVAEDPNTYHNADYSNIDPNMYHTHLMRDGRNYRLRTRHQEQSLPSALSTTDTTTSSSSSSSPSLSSLSSSMIVNVGPVTMAEMQDQMQTEGQNMRMGNRKKVEGVREVATQSFATDDLRQPTASMAINTWDKAAEGSKAHICIPSIDGGHENTHGREGF